MSKELKYSKNHLCICIENNTAAIGLSEHAVKQLGAIAFINLPDRGEVFQQGEVFGDVESIKTVSDLVFPVCGEIADVNDEILDNPENISSNIEERWLVKVLIENNDYELMDQDEYERYVESL